jgi:hypothetical protein
MNWLLPHKYPVMMGMDWGLEWEAPIVRFAPLPPSFQYCMMRPKTSVMLVTAGGIKS